MRKQFEKQSLRWVAGSSLALMLVFMHVVSWGEYSLEILPIKIGGYLGMSSAAGQERLAQICLATKKLDCVESAYQQQAWGDPGGLVRLGKFQFNRMKYPESAQTLHNFFTRIPDSTDLDARYVYARALSETQRIDEASQQFDLILAAKPDVLQVTVAQTYVKLLIAHGRYEKALAVLDDIRKRGENVAMFMESEYKDIATKLGKNT